MSEDVKPLPCRLCGHKPSAAFDQVSCLMCGIDAAPDAWNRLMAEKPAEHGTIYWRRKDDHTVFWRKRPGREVELKYHEQNWCNCLYTESELDRSSDIVERFNPSGEPVPENAKEGKMETRYWRNNGGLEFHRLKDGKVQVHFGNYVWRDSVMTPEKLDALAYVCRATADECERPAKAMRYWNGASGLWRLNGKGVEYLFEGKWGPSETKVSWLEKYTTEISEAEAMEIVNKGKPQPATPNVASATPNPADLSERDAVHTCGFNTWYRFAANISGIHSIRDFPRVRR